jgi:hypothetical protein
MVQLNPFDLKHQRPGPDGNLIEEFLSAYDSRKTRRGYRSDLKQFFKEEMVDRHQARQVQKEDIAQFLREQASSYARSTLKRKVETLRSFFRWLAEQGLVEERPIGADQKTTDLVDQILQEEEEGDEEPGGEAYSRKGTEGERPSQSRRGGPTSASFGGRKRGQEKFGHTDAFDQDMSGGQGAEGMTSGPVPSENPPKDDGSKGDRNSRSEKRFEQAEPDSGEDAFEIPSWVIESAEGNVEEVPLNAGESVPLSDLPSALRYALGEITSPSSVIDPTRLSVRFDPDLAVQVYYYHDRNFIEVKVQHNIIDRIVRTGAGGSVSTESVPLTAIVYLSQRDWALPPEVYEKVNHIITGPDSEGYPTWTREPAYSPIAQYWVAAEITGVLAEGFKIGKDEGIYLRKHT